MTGVETTQGVRMGRVAPLQASGDGGADTGSEAEIVPYEPLEAELNDLSSGNEQGVYRWLGTELGYCG